MVSLPVILYVEDNDDSRFLVEFMFRLADEDYTVVSVKTAAGAVNLIEKQAFDLFILDMRLPEISGDELCRKIRETDKQTPIMFFTAMARPQDRLLGISAGANEYLVKPDDLSCLTETAKRLLNKKKSNPELFSDPERAAALQEISTYLQYQ